ncbi:MAG: hypothetical protein EXX96DRAFT_57013 [Benjaminiella poitrasii]|nr:MAG: hypothetical protein EXX96DRAFT_57013 [Benjaminiella poitrasii]
MLLKTTMEELLNCNEEQKFDRIKEYVEEQKQYAQFYELEDCKSIPESCINDHDEINSNISASISELLKRKYHCNPIAVQGNTIIPLVVNDNNNNNGPHLPLVASERVTKRHPLIIKKKVLSRESSALLSTNPSSLAIQSKKDQEEDKPSKIDSRPGKSHISNNLPQTKANGFHLLNKFVSPNLEINRITIKSNQYSRPKLGLFNKGKSSANGKTVPDLVFSESEFLRPRPSQEKPLKKKKKSTPPQERPRSISRFFKGSSTPKHSSQKNKDGSQLSNTHDMEESSPRISHHCPSQQLRDEQAIFTKSSIKNHIPENGKQEEKHSIIEIDDDDDATSSSSSYATVKRLLQQCQQQKTFKPKLISPSLFCRHQMPSYSPVKTPTKTSDSSHMLYYRSPNYQTNLPQSPPLTNTKLQPSSKYHHASNIMSFNASTSQPIDDDSSIYMYFEGPRKTNPTEDTSSPLDHSMRSPSLNWQIAEDSVISTHDCIFPTVNLLEEDELDLQSFWSTHGYRRRL